MSERGNQGKNTGKSDGQKRSTKLTALMVVAGFVAAIITIKEYIVPKLRNVICPRPPTGLVIFDADQWHEQVVSGKNEIICQAQTGLNVELRKVGVGMNDATVERCLTYSKRQNNALEIEYEFAESTEIGAHFLIHGFRKPPRSSVQLDEYEEGYVFLRVKPIPIDDGTNTDDTPAVTFGLKVEDGKTSFWDNRSHSCAEGKRYWLSGWHDIRIRIKPYLDNMRKVSATQSDRPRFDALVIYFGQRYSSPAHGCLWLNTIRLVKEEKKPD